MIPVTKSFFPPQEDFQKYMTRVWKNKWLTNGGELFHELSDRLKEHLDVDNIIPMTNGTLPIQIALKVLGKEGEIITTPFSYVATTSSIVWENCIPVFVDIDSEHLTIDENKIEELITDNTTAILATHVYGNPCNVEKINEIAKRHNLSVIYDAAHCFGVKYKGNSIFNYGDVSTCSFHATKIFHTGEGGALFCKDADLLHKMYYSHNFGHNGQEEFHGLGINAKMSELQAAMGLSVLPFMEKIMNERQRVCEYYDELIDFENKSKVKIREFTEWNYSYYPLIFDTEELMHKCLRDLADKDIFPRRYFFPSLQDLPYINDNSGCEISKDISSRIICLPLYVELGQQDLDVIISTINKTN